LGAWYLKTQRDGGAISFQLSHGKRDWKTDPIFRSGECLVVVGFSDNMTGPMGTVGWNVIAMDQKLSKFEFYWSDETPFRSVWRR
jgi:hypothetical protein